MGRTEEAQRDLLTLTLQVAVPMWLSRLDGLDPEARDVHVRRWAADATDAVASRGDVLQFGGKRGEAGAVFNALARGLAALATCPGGVRFVDVLWCARHFPHGVASPALMICPSCVDDDAAYGTNEVANHPMPVALARVREIETLIPKEGIL